MLRDSFRRQSHALRQQLMAPAGVKGPYFDPKMWLSETSPMQRWPRGVLLERDVS